MTILLAFAGLFECMTTMTSMTKYISMFFLRDCLEDDEEFVVGEMTLELEASAAFIGVVALLVDGTIIFPLSSLISV